MRWEAYSPGSRVEHFAWWCETYLVQSIDQFAGKPLVLEDWQVEFMGEALSVVDADGMDPTFSSLALVLSRKNGKTTMLAAYALYRFFNDQTQPEILLAAASDKQAGRLFDACVQFVRRSPELSEQVSLREYIGEISRSDGGAKIMRMANSGDNLAGFNPSLVVADELASWTKPSQRKAWAQLTTAGGARRNTQVFTITTAAAAEERESGILGRLIDRNEALGDVEKHPGLTISRNFDARTLLYNYSAPTEDPARTDLMKLANPASWITEEFLGRQAANPELSKAEVLQLHGCVWVAGTSVWIDPAWWNAGIERGVKIPDGAKVSLGIDIGLVNDASAVVLAWRRPEDAKVVVEATVWTPKPTENVRLADVDDYVIRCNGKYQISGAFFDPRFYVASSERLDSEFGIPMIVMQQNSSVMFDAYQAFYTMIQAGEIIHAGDSSEFASHVLGAQAQLGDRGWRVSKIRQRQRIDALVASVMAVYGCVLQSDEAIVPGFFSV
jgi:phage terminase large subunit-like protein